MKKREIRLLYCSYVETKKRPPKKLKSFLKFSDLSKKVFKDKYNNLCEVEADIWRSSFKDLNKTLKSSTEFAVYSNREKGLAMMFAWFEFMEENKNFFKTCFKNRPWEAFTSGILDGFKKETRRFIKKIIKNGSMAEEFKNREFINDHMFKIFWPLFLQNLKLWAIRGRKGENEEWMDALIEKSMTFFFDSLAPNLFDSLFDFIKHTNSKK
jgi:hypothetical protein